MTRRTQSTPTPRAHGRSESPRTVHGTQPRSRACWNGACCASMLGYIVRLLTHWRILTTPPRLRLLLISPSGVIPRLVLC